LERKVSSLEIDHAGDARAANIHVLEEQMSILGRILQFYGFTMIIGGLGMLLFGIFATDVSMLGENAESHRQMMLFMSAPMTMGMGVGLIVGGHYLAAHAARPKQIVYTPAPRASATYPSSPPTQLLESPRPEINIPPSLATDNQELNWLQAARRSTQGEINDD
jgi:hypothetical protein